MSPLDRQQALFDELIDLPEADRDARLRSACAGDPLLLEQVRGLMHADNRLGPARARCAAPRLVELLDEFFRRRTAPRCNK